MGSVTKANFRTGHYQSELDDFDFEMSAAMDAIKRCKTAHEEALLQAHFEKLLARAESHLGGWEP